MKKAPPEKVLFGADGIKKPPKIHGFLNIVTILLQVTHDKNRRKWRFFD